MTSISLFVRGQPVSTNVMYRLRRKGRGAGVLYLSGDALRWEQTVKAEMLSALGSRQMQPPLVVSYRFCGVRGDVDNYLKPVNDGLKRALHVDDRHFQIGSAIAEREGIPGVWLTIVEVNNEPES